jgi:NarL family two-component system response regulator LiaR
MQDRASPARLIIADDSALVRDGMRAMLAREPDVEVVAEAANGEEALRVCRALRPDLVLMDVRMPKMDGLAATRQIKAECPKTAVLIVTTHESPDYLMDAIKAGAAGYVLKEATRAQLTNAIRRALGGESPMNQELAMRLLRRLADEERLRTQPSPEPATKRQQPPPGSLTSRELDVLRHLIVGKTNRQIAEELHLSLSTVKGHLERLLSKLEVSDRTQAAVKAVELGLVAPLPKEE